MNKKNQNLGRHIGTPINLRPDPFYQETAKHEVLNQGKLHGVALLMLIKRLTPTFT